jgi:8-oxo-dGTP pyrophosphatase MutT (NUDIX family)
MTSFILREAACILLLSAQPKTSAIRVLMVKRHSKARFMSNVYVFPGGCREPEDGAEPTVTTFMRNAARELREEAGIALTAESTVVAASTSKGMLSDAELRNVLVPFARWVTPKQEKYRYDTWFFGAEGKRGGDLEEVPLVVDAAEIADAQWVRPETALRWHVDAAKSFRVPPPTHILLQELCLHDTPQSFLESYRTKNYTMHPERIPINEPTLELEGEKLKRMYISPGVVPPELTPQNRSSYPQWQRVGEVKEGVEAVFELKNVPLFVGPHPPVVGSSSGNQGV